MLPVPVRPAARLRRQFRLAAASSPLAQLLALIGSGSGEEAQGGKARQGKPRPHHHKERRTDDDSHSWTYHCLITHTFIIPLSYTEWYGDAADHLALPLPHPRMLAGRRACQVTAHSLPRSSRLLQRTIVLTHTPTSTPSRHRSVCSAAMAVAHPPSEAQASRQQPPWAVPHQIDPAPQLVVYNSLTRTKTPFVPLRGNHITWYNCGPTVYDASHMGHARNYVSQDIMRRILNHLGYSIHFVMNITDIDDKIIVRARQNHLLDEFKKANPTLTSALVKDVRKSWSAFLTKKKLEQFAPPAPAGEDIHEDAIWEEISRLNGDPKWRAETLAKEPMFGLWFNALNESRQAIIAATMAVTAINGASPPTPSDDLVSASKDILSSSLDDSLKHTVSNHSIFRSLAATWETAYFDDMKRLNVLPPSQLTRVSEYVPEIVTFTEKIIRNGFAYDDGTGNVYFDTKAFDGADLSDGEKASYAKLAPWSKGNKELLAEGEGERTAEARRGAVSILCPESSPAHPPHRLTHWRSRQEAVCIGLCPVEGLKRWRALLAFPLGSRSARVAHRVQCDG